MKIRANFVSNSSSSSFIILGKKIDFCKEEYEELLQLVKDGSLYAVSEWDFLGEGLDFFRVTEEIFNSIFAYYYNLNQTLNFIEVFNIIEDEGDIKKDDIKKDVFNIFHINEDYHSTDSLEEFEDRYVK